MVTPFNADLSVDYTSLRGVTDHVSSGGVDYLVVMGTTGENPTLSWKEQLKVLESVVDFNSKNLPVVFGLGGNNTYDLISKLPDLKSFRLQAILSVTPYYNRPSQAGIIKHFEAIADASPFDVILYNVPARTSSMIESESIGILSKHPKILGLKDAVGDIKYTGSIKTFLSEDFHLISGDDHLTLPIIDQGGIGVISVLANLLPNEVSSMVNLAVNGNITSARDYDRLLAPFYKLMIAEGNPSSIKAGMKAGSIMEKFMRLPLVEGSEELEREFATELMKLKKDNS